VKKIIVLIAWVALLFSMAGVQAGEYVNGIYLGGKLGVNYSRASGVISAPNKGTIAYVLQGGYLQGGYIFESKTLVLGVGSYFDWNPLDTHDNGVAYGSRTFGFDTKVGLPLGSWMPYAKLGYGYSTGTKDLGAVAQNSLNAAFGLEYKIAPQWSLLGEYKTDDFGGKNVATSIKNKTISFGFNYYFEVPPVVVAPVVQEVEDVETAPAPVVVPKKVEDAPDI
jgi:opacity protein-like surface antigen